MADYFTNFSLILPLSDEPAQAYALKLVDQVACAQEEDKAPDDFPASLAGLMEGWRFETDANSSPGKWGLWLHSSSGGIEAVCAFIQHLLQKFEPQGCVAFEWSHDCSKPRMDAYGGGAAIITARKIKTLSTADWLIKNADSRAPTTRRRKSDESFRDHHDPD